MTQNITTGTFDDPHILSNHKNPQIAIDYTENHLNTLQEVKNKSY